MAVQHFQIINERIKEQFLKFKQDNPDKLKQPLNFSWSNWGFGMESLEASARRLSSCGIKYIELHGNHYGNDLGYRPKETLKILEDHDIKVGGICGMFSVDNDLSSNRNVHRQNAIDYLRREIEFGAEVGANYILVVPGAVGRAAKYDDYEFERSVETLQVVADDFKNAKIRAAIEPVRSDEVSFVHRLQMPKNTLKPLITRESDTSMEMYITCRLKNHILVRRSWNVVGCWRIYIWQIAIEEHWERVLWTWIP